MAEWLLRSPLFIPHAPLSVDGELKLYPAQSRAVERFGADARGRHVLAFGTGCGKTPTAIRAVLDRFASIDETFVSRPRILVLCPAIVRHHWKREFARWANLEAHVIEMGRRRVSGTKAQKAARDKAFAASIQIVSYDLASHVDAEGWHAILFDECHHLADCQSKQSKVARHLMGVNPNCMALGLSATLIPTRVQQLWHPLYLLFGAEWGRPPRAGKVSWDFVKRYCHIEQNDYGAQVGSLLPGAEDRLRTRLQTYATRLTREDIADDLPPIDISTLEMPGQDIVANVVEWVAALENDVTHAVVLVYHREIAQKIWDGIRFSLDSDTHCVLIDGELPSSERVAALDACEHAERAMVIATTESIREGIRLMWAQKVLLAEWRQSPKQVLQVLGRFNSVGDRRRPQIQVLTSDETYGASQKLLSRMATINNVIRAGGAETSLQQTFASAQDAEAAILRQTQAMFAGGIKDDSDWLDDTEEEDGF